MHSDQSQTAHLNQNFMPYFQTPLEQQSNFRPINQQSNPSQARLTSNVQNHNQSQPNVPNERSPIQNVDNREAQNFQSAMNAVRPLQETRDDSEPNHDFSLLIDSSQNSQELSEEDDSIYGDLNKNRISSKSKVNFSKLSNDEQLLRFKNMQRKIRRLHARVRALRVKVRKEQKTNPLKDLQYLPQPPRIINETSDTTVNKAEKLTVRPLDYQPQQLIYAQNLMPYGQQDTNAISLESMANRNPPHLQSASHFIPQISIPLQNCKVYQDCGQLNGMNSNIQPIQYYPQVYPVALQNKVEPPHYIILK